MTRCASGMFFFLVVFLSCQHEARIPTTATQAAPSPAWLEQFYNGGGGYWRGRLQVQVENTVEKPVLSAIVQVRVGTEPGQAHLAGEAAEALRICDERGQELLFECLGDNGRPRRQGALQPGDTIFFTAQCEPHAKSIYYIYFDNSQAQGVDDFLKAPDRIENGGFELGTSAPEGWSAWGADEHRRVNWVAEDPHLGQRCGRVDVDSGQEPSWVKWGQGGIPITPGCEYVFRAWVRAQNVVGKAGWFIHVNGPNKPQLINKVLDAGSGTYPWKELTFRFTAPPEATDVTVGTVLYGTGTAWYDDASLEAQGRTSSLVVRVVSKEKITLNTLPARLDWPSGPWQCRIPITVRNFTGADRKHQLVCVELSQALKSLMRKANLRALRMVEPTLDRHRSLPHFLMNRTLGFLADVPPMSERTYYLYITFDSQAPCTTTMEYLDLVKSKANLVKNPGFEEGNALPADWEPSPTRGGDKVLWNALRDKSGQAGDYCARLEVPPGAPLCWSGWRQMIPVEPNATYFYSGFLKTKDTEGSVTLHAHIRDAERKQVRGQWAVSTHPGLSGTTEWTQSSGFIRTPGDCRFIELHLTSNVHGTVWHDNILLCRMCPAILGKVEWKRIESLQVCSIWEVNPLIKVFREDAPEPFAGTVRVQLARNEYEPVQLVVKCNRAVKGASARVVLPKNRDGVELKDITINPVGYVPVDYPTNYYSSTAPPAYRLYPSASPRSDGWPGDWPDPLRPPGPFDLKADSAQPLWITVHTQSDTPSGDYHGKIVLDLPGIGQREIPFHVIVWDFTLPKNTKLRVIYDLSLGNIRKYDTRPDEKSILRQWYKNMAAHRICPDRIRPEPKIGFKDGAVQFDASEFDQIAQYCLEELGMNSFYAPGLYYALGWAYPPRKIFGLEPFTPEYNEALTKTLRVYMEHLRQKGWDKRVILYVSDEPHYRVPGVVENLVKYCKLVHQVAGVRTYSSTWNFVPGLIGAIDIWGVGMHGSFPLERIKERQAAGDDFLFTTDGHMCIDTPYLAVERLLPYYCWKYNVSGYEFWGICWWTYNPWERGWHKYIQQSDSPDKPKYYVRYPNGDGYLCYPGQPVGVEGPINSIRLEQAREGIEDYDYFCILKDFIDEARKKGISVVSAEQALTKARDLAHIPNEGGLRSTELMPNPDAIPTVRAAVAQEILNLKKQLTGK